MTNSSSPAESGQSAPHRFSRKTAAKVSVGLVAFGGLTTGIVLSSGGGTRTPAPATAGPAPEVAPTTQGNGDTDNSVVTTSTTTSPNSYFPTTTSTSEVTTSTIAPATGPNSSTTTTEVAPDFSQSWTDMENPNPNNHQEFQVTNKSVTLILYGTDIYSQPAGESASNEPIKYGGRVTEAVLFTNNNESWVGFYTGNTPNTAGVFSTSDPNVTNNKTVEVEVTDSTGDHYYSWTDALSQGLLSPVDVTVNSLNADGLPETDRQQIGDFLNTGWTG